MRRSFLALAAAAAAVGCSHDKPPVAPTPAPPPVAAQAPEPAAPPPAPVAVSPNLTVAGDLARQCSLRFNSTPQAPMFDFDRFELLPEDRDVLDQVATCLT